MVAFLNQFESWQIAIFLKPFVMFVLTVLVLYPARVMATRYIPEGKVKRLLLRRIS